MKGSNQATQIGHPSAQVFAREHDGNAGPDQAQPRGTTLINMGVAALIIAGLYFGREIFVPVALAVLLSFVLAPFVSRLQSLRLPSVAAVLAVAILSFAIIFSLGA